MVDISDIHFPELILKNPSYSEQNPLLPPEPESYDPESYFSELFRKELLYFEYDEKSRIEPSTPANTTYHYYDMNTKHSTDSSDEVPDGISKTSKKRKRSFHPTHSNIKTGETQIIKETSQAITLNH